MEISQSASRSEIQDRIGNPVAITTEANTLAVAPSTNVGQRLAAELEVFESVAKELRSKLFVGSADHLRRKQVVTTATELFGLAPTWVAFYREMMGIDGVIRTLFPKGEDLREYENSEEHTQLLDMLTVLRSRDLPENDPSEPQRMITVRIPKSLHDAVCAEANALKVSVNKLCITRMLQLLDDRMIPSSKQKRRGRKPGSPENCKRLKPAVSESGPVVATPPPTPEFKQSTYSNVPRYVQ